MKNIRFSFLQANKSLMKKITVLALALLSASVIYAQQRPYPTFEDAAKFKKSVTCVVREDDPFSFYNAEIKAAVDKYWKVTPVKYITVEQFNVMRNDPAYSFLVLTITNFSNDKSGSTYDFLNLTSCRNSAPYLYAFQAPPRKSTVTSSALSSGSWNTMPNW